MLCYNCYYRKLAFIGSTLMKKAFKITGLICIAVSSFVIFILLAAGALSDFCCMVP